MSDLISRQELLEKLYEWYKRSIYPLNKIATPEYTEGENAAYETAIYEIENAPTVDAVEVKRGRWMPHPTEREWDVCSVCGIGTKRREYGLQDGREWVTEWYYPYCPNCGAKMEVDE